jgi:hypothetical protein
MQPYYIPFSYLSNNSYYNSTLYNPIYIGNIREFPNYTPSIDRISFPTKNVNPRTSNNVSHKHTTPPNQAKENTAGRKF